MLVDRVVDVRREVRDLLDVVLERHREPLAVREVRERGVEQELRVRADRQPRSIRPRVDHVHLHAVERVRPAAVESLRDLAEDERALAQVVVDVEPELVPEAPDRPAEQTPVAVRVRKEKSTSIGA